MDSLRTEIIRLTELMAQRKETVRNAVFYLEGLGKDASMKELNSHFIEFLIQDGSAMGFDLNDDIGDIVSCMDDIAEHFHLLISYSWFSEEDGLVGSLKKLGERWGRNGVKLLWLEDPKGSTYPVYAVSEEEVPAILEQARIAGIPVCDVSEMTDDDEEEDDGGLDWSMELE